MYNVYLEILNIKDAIGEILENYNGLPLILCISARFIINECIARIEQSEMKKKKKKPFLTRSRANSLAIFYTLYKYKYGMGVR